MPTKMPTINPINIAPVVPAELCTGFKAFLPAFLSVTTSLSRVLISYPIIKPDKTQPHKAKPIWLMLIID